MIWLAIFSEPGCRRLRRRFACWSYAQRQVSWRWRLAQPILWLPELARVLGLLTFEQHCKLIHEGPFKRLIDWVLRNPR